jgi:hypothetical protein
LPTRDEPVDPSTDVVLLEDHEVPEVGRRYGVPLYIHCGMDWLDVGGEPWRRTDDGPGPHRGSGDDHSADDWPVAQETVFGFVTLRGADVLEYSIGDGDVIATYGRSEETPPGCM